MFTYKGIPCILCESGAELSKGKLTIRRLCQRQAEPPKECACRPPPMGKGVLREHLPAESALH